MTTEYTIAMSELKPDADQVIARVPEVVDVVAEHFAIREIYLPHGAGEGLYLQAFVLDHMASGYRAWGGPASEGWTYEGCEAFAKSIATAPIEWAERRAQVLKSEGHRDFFRAATKAAAGAEPTSIDFADFDGA